MALRVYDDKRMMRGEMAPFSAVTLAGVARLVGSMYFQAGRRLLPIFRCHARVSIAMIIGKHITGWIAAAQMSGGFMLWEPRGEMPSPLQYRPKARSTSIHFLTR